jgi:23S rRNA (uracil1939-C5)-methyltransferase
MNSESTTTQQKPLQSIYTKGQQVEVDIIDAGEAEKCFGRLDEGVAVFVRGQVAVGDRVIAEIYKIKKAFLEAKLLEIASPSPERVRPTCSHFGVCGGCKWQHVRYEEQLRIKQKQVADVLEHIGDFSVPDVRPVLPAKRQFGYRNKVDFSFSEKRFLLAEEIGLDPEELTKPVDFALGFHAPLRYAKAIDIDYCYLGTPAMNRVLEVVRAFGLDRELSVYSTRTHQGFLRNLVVRQGDATGEVMVNLVTSWHDESLMEALGKELSQSLGASLASFVNNVTNRKNLVAFGDQEFLVLGKGVIRDRIGDNDFDIAANSFFQTNTEQAGVLYDTIMELAELKPEYSVLDLYCGTGSISLHVAAACKQVCGIELNDGAIQNAIANAALNDVTNCEFRKMDLKDLGGEEDLEAPDVVIADPPRAGMHPKTLKTLLRLRPPRIVYVSCKPSSLARDGAVLCENGVYTLGRVQPVDMFPNTNHVEAVAVLVRNG